MSIVETLIAALVAALVAAAGFFQAWRGAKRRERRAEAWGAAVQETLNQARRTQAASDQARQDGEKAVQSVREAAKAGRRDHFQEK
jgi:hypothetical protein